MRETSVSAYVGLGCNQGDCPAILSQALCGISRLPGIRSSTASSLYRTQPQGDRDQPFFLNQVVKLECAGRLRPVELLDHLQTLEASLGRVRDPKRRFGPRTVDLDLLLFNNVRMDTERLTLPHPRMLDRAFVLVPLAEIAPGLALPDGGTVEDALAELRFSLTDDMIFQDF